MQTTPRGSCPKFCKYKPRPRFVQTHALMTQSIEQAEALRQQAIALLITDRTAIEEKLTQLGYDGTTPTQKKKVCSLCQSADHNARTCPTRPTPSA
jgi:hypothetical protein